MTLKENGWRFVLRGVTFKWVSEAELNDIDCTDMADDELQSLCDQIPVKQKAQA
jgi:hypothetical protein